MRIAVLAFQGAFAEHQQMLSAMGIDSFLVRNAEDWQQPKDGLIIPGGESTAMMRIARDLELTEPMRHEILGGLPVLGTCAGLIMLDKSHLGTMDIVAQRNAYGRQLGSFHTTESFKGIGPVPMTFIRAPYIKKVGHGVEVMAEVDGHIVAARQGNQLVTAFHPELDDNYSVHSLFLQLCQDALAK